MVYLTGMYSSSLPPGKTPINLGPNLRSERRVKMTLSMTRAVRQASEDAESCSFKALPKILRRTSEGSRPRGLTWVGRLQQYIRLLRPPLENKRKLKLDFPSKLIFLTCLYILFFYLVQRPAIHGENFTQNFKHSKLQKIFLMLTLVC